MDEKSISIEDLWKMYPKLSKIVMETETTPRAKMHWMHEYLGNTIQEIENALP